MTRLVRVEIRRLLARRAVKLLLLLPLLVFTIELVATIPTHSKDLAAAHAKAHTRFLQETTGAQVKFCKQVTQPAPAQSGSASSGPGETQTFCEGATEADFFHDPRLVFGSEVKTGLEVGVVLFSLVGFLIGATGIGAEWAAGTFAYLLTWSPRRVRVLGAKTAALIKILLAMMVVTLAVEVGFQWIAATLSGTFDGGGPAIAESVREAARGMLVVVTTTCIGAAVAGIARNSSAALGVLLAYLVGVESILRHVFPWLNPWTLVSNAQAVVAGHIGVSTSRHSDKLTTLHAGGSSIKLSILAVIVTCASAYALQRRDVT